MKIPKKFKLFGQEIKVEYDDTLHLRKDFVGLSLLRQNIILIDDNKIRPQNQIEQTFLHELLHFILEGLQEKELNDNEKLIDLIAGLLHQAFETMEY